MFSVGQTKVCESVGTVGIRHGCPTKIPGKRPPLEVPPPTNPVFVSTCAGRLFTFLPVVGLAQRVQVRIW